MKKYTSLLSAFTLSVGIFSSFAYTSYADQTSDLNSLKSKYIVLMDYNSGQVLYKKNANQKMYPASTTKIWTAYCVLEKAKSLDELIEIKDIPEIDGSSMYLENGEKFTVRELLQSLLIHSSNDVAYVLAKHFGQGSPSNFVNFMNKEAEKYGANHTHFNNPHGLPDTDHYTSAMDMAILSRIAYGNPTISNIVKMKSLNIKASNRIKVDRNLINSNKFLTSDDTIEYRGKDIPIKYGIIDGIKTGFTDDAGNCLVSTAKRGNIRIIANVFNSPGGSLYHDSRQLIDYGLDNYKSTTIYKANDIKGEKRVRFASPGKVKYKLANDYSITTMNKDDANAKQYSYKYNFDKLKMPVNKGDIIGTMNIYKNGEMVSSIGLVAENSSQSYLQLVLSKLGIGKDKKVENQVQATNNRSSHKASDNPADTKDKSRLDDKSEEGKNILGKVKKEGKSSLNGLFSIFSDLGGFFSGIRSIPSKIGNFSSIKSLDPSSLSLDTIMKSKFYKYLDKQLANKTGPIPSMFVIFGLPILVIIIILWLIISLLRDVITGRRYRDVNEKIKKMKKNNKRSNNRENQSKNID